MRRVPVEAIADGMLLARPVEDRLGRVLLTKGDALHVRYREKFLDWGIEEVWVEGEADPAADLAGIPAPSAPVGATPANVQAAARVERRFRGFGEDKPVMMGLKRLALKHLGGETGQS